ncbi:amidase [Cnuibacter physcomitrellae]|uniref:Amidase n=1 Tax=Cnuibacter physcomitrellae TaxID=1619308 RepID=A0A1X9LKG0_9MICO|nr:amidase [Cnuibacter physcomitrellae]ARJ05607.1 amidase [Cnuibacter physcomitrellae]GGI36070.1 amidase [Cnuibacter physcomitrellae]
MTDLHELTALEQWRLLQRGEVGVLELTDHYLDRIDTHGEAVGAFVTVTAERARRRAETVQSSVPRTAPLWGLPHADKDLVRTAGVRTTFGSRLFEHFVPEESDALAVQLDEAGAVSLGKTTTPEFGLPSYTESRVAPPTRTPWDLSRGAGGSSGGAAAAVAAGLLPFATGSDGGGSIRIPAAACGLVGIKPSRGLVPAGSGLGAPAGLPVAGTIGRTVEDVAFLLDGIIAKDGDRIRFDHTLRAPAPEDGLFLGAAVRGEGRFQIGVLTDSPWRHDYDIVVDPEATAALDVAVSALDALGHGLERISLEPTPDYSAAFRVIWQAGASLIPAATDEELDLLEPLTRWLVLRGRELPASSLVWAIASLSDFEAALIRQFSAFDAVLTPTLAMTPRPIGWYDQEDGERNFAQQVQYTPFTSFVNASGLPALTLPVHWTDDGLPMGAQLIGRPGGEATLLALGRQLERRLDWTARRPPVW